jgi:hypothetical protein
MCRLRGACLQPEVQLFDALRDEEGAIELLLEGWVARRKDSGFSVVDLDDGLGQ